MNYCIIGRAGRTDRWLVSPQTANAKRILGGVPGRSIYSSVAEMGRGNAATPNMNPSNHHPEPECVRCARKPLVFEAVHAAMLLYHWVEGKRGRSESAMRSNRSSPSFSFLALGAAAIGALSFYDDDIHDYNDMVDGWTGLDWTDA
ncbi:hypothetical protein BKA81DRAFT_375613 [Phyllosticta paracitricarpa]|uniref:Uncharacterized protein n=1 Tax=Phyllosticta citricarpa TaxID=55181 RepID=A0ABR1MHF8_9PEZI